MDLWNSEAQLPYRITVTNKHNYTAIILQEKGRGGCCRWVQEGPAQNTLLPVQQRSFFLPWCGLPNTLGAKQLARSILYRWISSGSQNTVQMNPSGTWVLDMVFVSCLPRLFATLHKSIERAFHAHQPYSVNFLRSQEGVWANCSHAASSPSCSESLWDALERYPRCKWMADCLGCD